MMSCPGAGCPNRACPVRREGSGNGVYGVAIRAPVPKGPATDKPYSYRQPRHFSTPIGLSYGFRPGRSPHQALAALHTALMSQRVSWVLDADIRSFFDSVDHEWLLRMLAHRIADPRVLRLIRMWLEAGVLESGEIHETDRGTPQGSGIS